MSLYPFFYRAVGCLLGFQGQWLCHVSPALFLLRCHEGECGCGLILTSLSRVGTLPPPSWSSQVCELGIITLLAEKVSLKNQNEHQRSVRVSVCLLPRERCSAGVQKNTLTLVCNDSRQDNSKLTVQRWKIRVNKNKIANDWNHSEQQHADVPDARRVCVFWNSEGLILRPAPELHAMGQADLQLQNGQVQACRSGKTHSENQTRNKCWTSSEFEKKKRHC